jgi:hypothetical protein
MTDPARQVARLTGYPCVNCRAEPCTCVATIVDHRGNERGERRRYQFPDGAILTLDERDWPAAEAAGAVPWVAVAAGPDGEAGAAS